MSPPLPADHAARHEAVFSTDSCIVQAPAGSGKTELLVQRYLRLLAEVERPDAVLAITFTRKAAAEMRSRILSALALAREPEPEAPHAAMTWRLARAVVERDAAAGWELEASPAQLRVETIDALCGGLARQLPLLSGFGGDASPTDDPGPLYRTAAREVLGGLESEDPGGPVATLLDHLDGNARQLLDLLETALGRRARWLPHLAGPTALLERDALEAALERRIHHELARSASQLAPGTAVRLREAIRESASFTAAEGVSAPLFEAALAVGDDHPLDDAGALPLWRAAARLLLTDKGEVRKRVDKSVGVPAKTSASAKADPDRLAAHRDSVLALLGTLTDEPALAQSLAATAVLPEPRYSDAEWSVVSALIDVHRVAAAQLALAFGQAGQVDFGELELAALAALGEHDSPSDVLLGLDATIAHILVDEFQDTSSGQLRLLELLTTDWSPGDGRSVLLVGDPMQSIYRFRQAEVGNFLNARSHGLGALDLRSLALTVNFRSVDAVVDWNNATFAEVLPRSDDPARGAVTFADAEAFVTTAEPTDGVTVHAALDRDPQIEAERVASIVHDALERHDGTVAVLVRSRAHLGALLPTLRDAGIAFQAVEAEALTERPVVRELDAMRRALDHGADGAAWLGVLRAPWCGLSLDDAHALFAGVAPWTDVLAGVAPVDGLTPSGALRVERVVSAFATARREIEHFGFARTLERLWRALDGPACVTGPSALTDARSYLDLLRRHERAGSLKQPDAFAKGLERLYAAPEAGPDARVQVMTMHKSKGLEFDTVILPSLHRKPRGRDRPLLNVDASPAPDDGGPDGDLLAVAPLETPGTHNALFRWLQAAESERDRLETGRLLYVAATRARRELHLVASARLDARSGDLRRPDAGSLLAPLWSRLEADFEVLSPPEAEEAAAETASSDRRAPPFARIADSWLRGSEGRTTDEMQAAANPTEEIEFDWAGENARHIGTLVHRWVERLTGSDHLESSAIDACAGAFRAGLRNLGVADDAVEAAAERVATALSRMLADPRGRWLLAPHDGGEAELGLVTTTATGYREMVVDRTFIDADGTRWIVDYKTGSHEGGDLEAFLDSEQERYGAQLEGYARALDRIDPRPTRLGLYFPMVGAWREWTAATDERQEERADES